jgi:hypothetical protein
MVLDYGNEPWEWEVGIGNIADLEHFLSENLNFNYIMNIFKNLKFHGKALILSRFFFF